MPSLFDEDWADASADIDAEFGETFELIPTASVVRDSGLMDPNARSNPSVIRPPQSFVGIFFDKGASLNAHGRTMADSTTRPIVGEKAMIDVDRTQFSSDPVRGDVVRRIDPPQVYEVTAFVVDDLNRAWLQLAERRVSGSAR